MPLLNSMFFFVFVKIQTASCVQIFNILSEFLLELFLNYNCLLAFFQLLICTLYVIEMGCIYFVCKYMHYVIYVYYVFYVKHTYITEQPIVIFIHNLRRNISFA